MKKLTWVFTLCLLMGAFACSPEENDQLSKLNKGDVDHFVFGRYFGHCLGNCTTVYLLKEDGLYADLVDRGYPDSTIAFVYTSRTAEFVTMAKKLLADFPDKLMDEEEETIGCPDCADQGGYYLEIKQGKTTRSWWIDTDDSRMPAYLSAYTEKVGKLVDELEK